MAVGLVYFSKLGRGTKVVTRLRGISLRNEIKGVMHCGSPGFVLMTTAQDAPPNAECKSLENLRDMVAKVLTYDKPRSKLLGHGINMNLSIDFTNRRGLKKSTSLQQFRDFAAENNRGGDVTLWMDQSMARAGLSWVIPKKPWVGINSPNVQLRKKAGLGLVTKYYLDNMMDGPKGTVRLEEIRTGCFIPTANRPHPVLDPLTPRISNIVRPHIPDGVGQIFAPRSTSLLANSILAGPDPAPRVSNIIRPEGYTASESDRSYPAMRKFPMHNPHQSSDQVAPGPMETPPAPEDNGFIRSRDTAPKQLYKIFGKESG